MSVCFRQSRTRVIYCNSACPRRGAVMVIALLSLILLASMVFYVFNVGHHVAKKVETQNAADAAAISGAGWVARSFNTVAMNNVETTRLIAYAAVLDAVPQAIDYTITDQTAIRDAINQQLVRGVGTDPWLRDGLLEARLRTEDQLAMLRPLQELFRASGGKNSGGGGYDVGRMTYYRPPAGVAGAGRGDLWQAIDSLSALSQATMENLTPLASQNASRAAEVNQTAGSGLLLPWTTDIPWEQGSFEDFRLPVLNGRLPPRQDDPLTNRGPFDTLFGFQDFRLAPGSPEGATPGMSDNSGGGDGDSKGVLRNFRLRDWAPPSPESDPVASGGRGRAVSYNTYGAYRDMRRRGMDLSRSPQGHASSYQGVWPESRYRRQHPLAPSLWARHLSFIADRKINFCFPGAASDRVVRQSRWILNYDKALEIERTGQPSIGYGLYLVFDYARNEQIGGVDLVHPTPVLQSWGLYQAERDILNPPGLAKVADHIWLDQHVETLDPFGSVSGQGIPGAPYRRRMVRYYVFVGVQVGEPAAVRNPFNFDAEDRNTLPGPINFPPEVDRSRQKFVPGTFGRDDRSLAYLGIAYQSKLAPMWSDAFDENRPDRHQVAVAQAQVFNNHSWDLWTQMWHSQLTPIDRYGEWLDVMDEAGYRKQTATDQVPESVRQYLRATQPLVELMAQP